MAIVGKYIIGKDVLGLTSAAVPQIGFSDSIQVTDSAQASLLEQIASTLAFDSVVSSVLVQTKLEVLSEIAFSDDNSERIRHALSDTFVFTDTISVHAALERIVDVLGLGDSFLWRVQDTRSFASTLGLDDSWLERLRLSFSDTLTFADAIVKRIRKLLEFQSTFALLDTWDNRLTFLAEFLDSISLGDDLSWAIQKKLSLIDTIELIGQVGFEGERFLVWGVNPKTFAAFKWSYLEPINSFAKVGGKNLFCTKVGVYEVTGTQDGAASIPAYLRTGLMDFGRPELKQLLGAYLVFTAEGNTLLKVRTTKDGNMLEYWYECVSTPNVVARARTKVGRNLKSNLYQFELKPLAGKPAKYTTLEVMPLVLSRSI